MTSSRGLGDSIAKFTHFFGLDRFASWFAEKVLGLEDCGCSRRQSRLNKLFPYKKNKVYDSETLHKSGFLGFDQGDDNSY